MAGIKNFLVVLGILSVLGLSALSREAVAAETKIGVIDMKKVLSTSVAGKRAQSIIEQKMKSYDTQFKAEKDKLIAMRQEMEKKSSAWSDEVKQQKFGEFQKKSAELGNKEREAGQEMKSLQDRHVTPVLKKLEEVVDQVAQNGNFSLILPRNVVMYTAQSHDISDLVIAELNKAMK